MVAHPGVTPRRFIFDENADEMRLDLLQSTNQNRDAPTPPGLQVEFLAPRHTSPYHVEDTMWGGTRIPYSKQVIFQPVVRELLPSRRSMWYSTCIASTTSRIIA